MKKPDMQQMLEKLNSQFIKELQQEVKQNRETLSLTPKRSDENDQQLYQILKCAGINVKEFEKSHKKDEIATNDFLKKVRPGLINRKADNYAGSRLEKIYNEVLNSRNYVTANASAAWLITHDKSFATINNKLWVQPTNPAPIDIKDFAKGSGSGWWAVAGPPPPTADIYFYFIPDTTAKWNLTGSIAFDGFYIIKADDGILTHKYAKVKLTATTKAYQYSWQGNKTFKLLDIHETDANYFKFYDRTEFFDTSALLKKGDPVVVNVKITVAANASGGGSYAELNFHDGTANQILPAVLIADPV